MTKLTRNEVAAFLQENDHFLILSHRRPDGDTAGSSAALCRILRNQGKTAHILENPELTERFSWLHEGLTKPEAEEGDILICVDVASPGMLPAAHRHLENAIRLRLDHHASATSFTELELVDPHAAATGEIIYDISQELWQDMDSATADALYVAVSTDTGCFRYSNTDHHTFLVAAACSKFGARVYELNQQLFETNTLGRLKMQAWIVENLRLIREGRMAVVAIPRQVEQDIGVTDDDMDNISSFPRTIAGIEAAATLREGADGEIKLSVRTIPGYDATKVAERFGGGGHKAAAGANIRLPLAQAAAEVEKAMLEL